MRIILRLSKLLISHSEYSWVIILRRLNSDNYYSIPLNIHYLDEHRTEFII